ncbi:MAG: hypothetical protein K6G87_07130 [Butyrivibrio sp.]|uniref:hypothetical protein n=1 Tax=Butyrivibrio sp. TaxID=28121 RepID=UPI0025D117FB|nr:hypothetical protein [Butyrivibrio sp.]MCR5770990.1 hypothetical protein [Butyrivibrio sp.]
MEIELRNENLAIWVSIGAAIIIAGIFGFREYKKRKALSADEMSKYMGYGAMWMVDSMKGYRVRKVIHTVLNVIGIAGITMSILSSAYLMGRPSYTEEVTTGVQRRDIFLCLDISYSLYALNYDFVSNLKSVVEGLDGDRVGISIYNTSSVLYMPLTDDKEFACEKLDELEQYFINQNRYVELYEKYYDDITEEEEEEFYELIDELLEFEAGVAVNSDRLGSSLIGEGLATCLYDFPSLEDEERTRIILMVTDNAENAYQKPIVRLPEAADLCAKNDVVLFSIFPPEDTFEEMNYGYDFDELSDELRDSSVKTGGAFYIANDDLDTKGIVSDIQSHEAMQVDEITETRTYDMPKTPFIFIIVGICALAAARAGGAC